MTVSIPPLTLKSQSNVTSYSMNPTDRPTLEKLSNLTPSLTQDDRVALSIAALHEGYEPNAVDVNIDTRRSSAFKQCIDLVQDLSQAGKVALVRSLSEMLAASHISPDIALPVLPPVPDPQLENAWYVMSIEQAIAFAKIGRLDPAILALFCSGQSLQVIPSDLLAAARENLPGLMEALKANPSSRGQ